MVELLVWNKMFFLKKWIKGIKYRRFHIIEVHDGVIRDNLGQFSVITVPGMQYFQAKRWNKKRLVPRLLPKNIRKQLKLGAIVEVRQNEVLRNALREK